MAENVNLNTVGNLQDTTTAQTVLNANNALIETAFSDVLSLSGNQPNQMLSNLDMNSNQILNLPAPATINSPVRLGDVISASTAITIPPVGTSGAVVGLLNGGNAYSGTSRFTGVVKFLGSSVSIGTTTVLYLNNSAGNSGQVLASSGSSSSPTWITTRDVLTTTANFYVATTGNDTNSGSSSSPWLTIQHGINYILGNVDQAQNTAVLNVGSGVFAGFSAASGAWLGNVELAITGAGSASTFVQCVSNGAAVSTKDLTVIALSGMTLEDNGSSNGSALISCGQLCVLDIQTDMKFGAVTNGAHIVCTNGGVVNLVHPYTITGNAVFHLQASLGGMIIYQGAVTASIPSTLAFNTFAVAQYQGMIQLQGLSTFTGSGALTTTGIRFNIAAGGCLGGGGANDYNSIFPGTTNGAYVLSPPTDFVTGGTSTSATIVSPSITTPTITGTVSGAITFATPPATLVYTVTTLNAISSPATGMRAIVTDATGTTFGAVVSGGSTFVTPVYYNGSWRIG